MDMDSDNLPRLTTVYLDLYQSLKTIPITPKQLKTLHISLDPSALLEPLSDQLLDSWRHSNIHELHLSLPQTHSRMPTAYMQFLNFPSKLRTLVFTSPWRLTRDMRIALPPTLVDLLLSAYEDDSVATKPFKLKSTAPLAFVLPTSLTHFCLCRHALQWYLNEILLISHTCLCLVTNTRRSTNDFAKPKRLASVSSHGLTSCIIYNHMPSNDFW